MLKYPSATTLSTPDTDQSQVRGREYAQQKYYSLSFCPASSALQKEVASEAALSACVCHGRPTLLTSDVVESCLDNLANPVTFAPAVQNLWTQD